MITRRKFLHNSSLATTALLMDRLSAFPQTPAVKPNTINADTLAKFVDPLPIPAIAQANRTPRQSDERCGKGAVLPRGLAAAGDQGSSRFEAYADVGI